MEYSANDIKKLVEKLNIYRDAYYNRNESLVSDKEYDDMFDKLLEMERATGIVLSNSPSVSVGYEIKSELDEVVHDYPPMLSLDKTKDLTNIVKFLNGHEGLVMAKMDGLTCRITYRDGKLYRAETRGNGIKGEDITHNIKVVKNVPLSINHIGEVVIDGELIITRDNFEILKEQLVDNGGKKYKNSRNLASGSVRLLDSKKCSERNVEFIAWKVVKGSNLEYFSERLYDAKSYGFTVVPFVEFPRGACIESLSECIDFIKDTSSDNEYPIDGCVFGFDKCDYLDSLGYTSHHWQGQMAFKFYDDLYDTVIRDIDWTMGKTGALTPTAIFDTVEIDGTEVSRASLHNLTIMKKLNVRKDCSARVYKANMIIPQVDFADDDGIADFEIPSYCPICSGKTERVQENDSEILMCSNPDCEGKLLGKLSNFVSKQGMDIDGLSEGKLAFLIEKGYLKKLSDIYELYNYKDDLESFPGWGKSSVNKMLSAIEASKEVTLENFISSLNIPTVGLTTAKMLAEFCNNDVKLFETRLDSNFDWFNLSGIGLKLSDQINQWWKDHFVEYFNIKKNINIKKPVEKTNSIDGVLTGKTFCITGTFDVSRSELQKIFENLGGTFVPSVTKKTNILFCGHKAGSKLDKAHDLGITVYDIQATNDLIERGITIEEK